MAYLAIVIGLIVFIAWMRSRRGTRHASMPARVSNADPIVQDVVSTINNRKDYRAVRSKLERMESRSYATPAAQDRANETINVLREALEFSEDKTYRHQLIIEPSIFVSPAALKCAFEVLEFDDPRRAHPELVDPGLAYWNDMDDYNNPEPKPRWLNTLRELVSVLNSVGSVQDKMSVIDRLRKRKPSVVDEIICPDGDLVGGRAWRVEVLSFVGCPKAAMLVHQGIVTLEDTLTIDPAEFSKHKGIGSKTVAALVELQAAIRSGEVTEPFSGA